MRGRPPAVAVGQRFGRLVVVERAPSRRGRTNAHWQVRCDCGVELVARGDNLRGGLTESCGCLALERQREAGVMSRAQCLADRDLTVYEGTWGAS